MATHCLDYQVLSTESKLKMWYQWYWVAAKYITKARATARTETQLAMPSLRCRSHNSMSASFQLLTQLLRSQKLQPKDQNLWQAWKAGTVIIAPGVLQWKAKASKACKRVAKASNVNMACCYPWNPGHQAGLLYGTGGHTQASSGLRTKPWWHSEIAQAKGSSRYGFTDIRLSWHVPK